MNCCLLCPDFFLLLFFFCAFFVLFFKKCLFLIDWRLLYNMCLIFVIHQHELTIGVHVSPPLWISFPSPVHSHPLGYYRAPVWVPWIIQQIPIGCLFTEISVYAFMLLSPFTSPSPSSPPSLSISLFSASPSPLLLCEQAHQYRSSRFHIYVLIYDICFSLS